jgi:type I restriction enzyme S subunit
MTGLSQPLVPGDRSIRWGNQLPANWRLIPLKYLAGINQKTLGEDTEPGWRIRYIDIGSVNSDGQITDVGEFSFGEAPSRARRIVSSGDTLISTVRTYLTAITFCSHADDDLIASTGFAVLSPRPQIYPKYLFYWVRASHFVGEIVSRSTGVSYPAINAAEIGSLPFPVLAPSTQRAIVNFLDTKTAELDSLLAEKEYQIQLLGIKWQSLVSLAVTKGIDTGYSTKPSGAEWIGDIPEHWEVIRVKYLSKKIGSGKTPRGGAEIYTDDGVVFLRSQNIYDDGLHLDDVVYIDQRIDKDMADTRVQPLDVLLNITGASIGRTCVVPEGFPPANVNQHVCIIRPWPDRIEPRYLSYSLKSASVKAQIMSLENGSSRQGLNFEQIANLLIALPRRDLLEQAVIAEYLDVETQRISAIVKEIEDQISILRKYRQTLITEVVTGKINVWGVTQ